MSFIVELRQRKVFRVAAAYLLVAWVAIQAASIALPAFDAPGWMLRVVILLFALGLPVVLLLAWALELTPEGVKLDTRKPGSKRMLLAAGALALLALAWYFVGQPALRARQVPEQERSIAVLPFVNISGDPANDYFSDGLAETTLDMLAQVKNLKVIARSSSFAFKGKPTDARNIGQALGAAHLLEGSVQQAGDTVRITVQLIRATDGSELWSRHFDRQLTDVFKIQDEIAIAVVQALQVALPAPEQQRLLQKRTDNVPAYQEYLKGIALLPGRKVPEMRAAAQHFERAIQLDPDYARAYVGAFNAYTILDFYATITADERQRSERYLQHALALAPQLGEVHIALAEQLEAAGDLPAAEREFQHGLALAPGYAAGYQYYSAFLALEYGRFDEALAQLQKAIELDPLSPSLRNMHLFTLGQTGRIDEALKLSNAMIADYPDSARAYDVRGLLHMQRGDLVSALRDFRRQDTLDPASGNRAHRCNLLIDMTALVEARSCLSDLAQHTPVSGEVLRAEARLALIMGDTAGALALIPPGWLPSDMNRLNQARVLLASGQPAEALALYRKRMPEMFTQPVPRFYPGQAVHAIQIGAALLQTGARSQGRALLSAALATIAQHPYLESGTGRGWWEVVAYAQLGELDRAFAALQDGVNNGDVLGISDLDTDPLLANLRTDPRYAAILAPARTRVAAQLAAARSAGVL